MHMVMLVLDDPNALDDVLDAWRALGVLGATIIESTGLHRRRAKRADRASYIGFHRLVEGTYEGHYTLFSIVDTEATAGACQGAVEDIIGDLDAPNTGIFACWPLSSVKGLTPHPDEPTPPTDS